MNKYLEANRNLRENVLMVRPIRWKNGLLDSEQTPWRLEASPIGVI